LDARGFLEVERLPQDKPQLFSTLVTLVRETVKRVLFPASLHPPQTLPDSSKMKNSLTSSPQINCVQTERKIRVAYRLLCVSCLSVLK
jgi:hypothetical protein